ncbi:hypothetical protein SAMN06295974_3734 [Plantibacter flavus]|uniref:Secreted protein n=1 Tax=Plantibacter flavus TaxID=150123 RepID=A0A3N2BLN7_9MICO|nr:hypothetical protein [Plantibacter flavus]ROR76118.1 hypothetical protein EDD42_4071 [Plantibacter flavus]SMG48430.1 hypothetical protein SAMN06295974_3734 [Plantibacter flavus]
MRDILKRRRPLIIVISGAAALAIAAAAVTVSVATKPAPAELTGKAGERAAAAAADDWAALPLDEDGNPIGEPEIQLDEKGNPIIKPGLAEEKRSADQPLPSVKISDGIGVLDTTADTAGTLQLLLEANNPGVKIGSDACLLDWAATQLPASTDAFSGVLEVCGRKAAVMYGGYSTSVRDLNLHALYAPEEKERTALGKVLFKNDRLAYASVATGDGKGVLLVVTAATGPKDSTPDSITKVDPVVPKQPDVLPAAP